MFCFYFRKKTKAKAPLPPAETKYLDASSVDDSIESSAFIMEQKENMVDKDVELSVVLPGDVIKSTTVHGRYGGAHEIPGILFLLLSLKPSVVYFLIFFFDKICHLSLSLVIYLKKVLKGIKIFLMMF